MANYGFPSSIYPCCEDDFKNEYQVETGNYVIVDGVIKVKSDHSKTLTFKLCSQLYRYNYFEEGLGNIVYKFQSLPTGENIVISAVMFKYEPKQEKEKLIDSE